MKLSHVRAAHSAILQLIAADKANKFVMASATRIKLAANLKRVRPVIEAYEEEMQTLIKSLSTARASEKGIEIPGRVKDASGTEIPNQELAKYLSESARADASDFDVAFGSITHAELGENQIPIDLLADLMTAGILSET